MSMQARIVVLAGGIGAARFLAGLVRLLASESSTTSSGGHATVIGNTADDMCMFGLRVCPDLDSVMYTLGGGGDPQRGWGRADESFRIVEELRAYGAQPDWFQLGDLDIATHLLRTQLLRDGLPLSRVTRTLCNRWELPVHLLPMTDHEVETHVVVREQTSGRSRSIHFQEWWVRHNAEPEALAFVFDGSERCQPAPGVIEALTTADIVIIAPSNPVVSIGPILAVPGIREALVTTSAPVVGISPIIDGAPVRGMADKCLRAIGVPVTAAGVAGYYGSRPDRGVLDAWLIDSLDEDQIPEVEALGIACAAHQTLMSDSRAAAGVAREAMRLAGPAWR